LNFRLDLLGRVESRGKRDSGSTSLGDGESEEDLGGKVGGFVGSPMTSKNFESELREVRRDLSKFSDSHEIVTLDEVVLNALSYSHTSTGFVLHNSESEREGTSLGRKFGKGCSGSLHL
jgi:hypothetical protein